MRHLDQTDRWLYLWSGLTMCITELIERLTELHEKYGDQQTYILTEDWDYHEIQDVELDDDGDITINVRVL